jgi:ATP-dependent DNA helicase RecG
MAREIPDREGLSVEFKSDRARLSDRELVATVICLANTDGGDIYLGVEDDGKVTGLHPAHQNLTGMTVMIANHTSPSLTVRVEAIELEGLRIARIAVPKSRQLVATSDGLLQRRRLKADGMPECVPLLPHEYNRRLSDLSQLDQSAMPVPEARLGDFDPLERERLRQLIGTYGGDRSLLGLDDAELDGALGLVRRESGTMIPTVAGLLILGRENAIRDLLPSHEVAFQVMRGTDVLVNDIRRSPLLKAAEWVREQFLSRRVEREMDVGLFRVPVPNYDERAFREALVNAMVHRDYTRLGAIHVRWQPEEIVISSPGGFVEGVGLGNLLVVEPRPRNPQLADAMKRIGLAERTGRGIDLIYQGLLRYGRPAPDYSRSDRHSVIVALPGGDADLGVLQIVIEQENRLGHPLPVDSMIALCLLRDEIQTDAERLSRLIQRDESAARRVLERLSQAEMVQAHGSGRTRFYTLNGAVAKALGRSGNESRQTAAVLQERARKVLAHVAVHGRITRKDAAALFQISDDQASRLLRKLALDNKLLPHGAGRDTWYGLA